MTKLFKVGKYEKGSTEVVVFFFFTNLTSFLSIKNYFKRKYF